MANMWRRAMLYLGLGPDDEYEEYEAPERPGAEPRGHAGGAATQVRPAPPVSKQAPARAGTSPGSARPAPPAASRTAPASAAPRQPAGRGGKPAPPPPAPAAEPADAPGIRTVPASVAGAADIGPKPRPVVRPVPANAKPHAVTPTHFNDVQEIADKFKGNQPVIVNLQHTDKPLARRILDFSSGICYALGGHMEKVANQVYLIVPANVEVSNEEKRRFQERGVF
ncbi:MAG: cell division protein SepF [Acidimicrobiales bacterium]|nr:cell division protein SepF [Acidimicrobiales bacterium]